MICFKEASCKKNVFKEGSIKGEELIFRLILATVNTNELLADCQALFKAHSPVLSDYILTNPFNI